MFFLGSLTSVSVLRRLWEAHCELRVKRLHRYSGASCTVAAIQNLNNHKAMKHIFSYSILFFIAVTIQFSLEGLDFLHSWWFSVVVVLLQELTVFFRQITVHYGFSMMSPT